MAAPQRNPFARTVTRNPMRSTETIVNIIELGRRLGVIGEFITFVITKSETTAPVPIGGESGQRSQKLVSVSITWEATLYEGSDGNFWEIMHLDELNGKRRSFTYVTSTKDETTPEIGECIRHYNECRITRHNSTGMTTDGWKTITIGGTAEEEKLMKRYNNIQGGF